MRRPPKRCSGPLLLGESSRSKVSRLLRLPPRVSRAAETSRRRAGPRTGVARPGRGRSRRRSSRVRRTSRSAGCPHPSGRRRRLLDAPRPARGRRAASPQPPRQSASKPHGVPKPPLLPRAARREEREIAEAHASAQRQAARYADSEMRRKAAGGVQHERPQNFQAGFQIRAGRLYSASSRPLSAVTAAHDRDRQRDRPERPRQTNCTQVGAFPTVTNTVAYTTAPCFTRTSRRSGGHQGSFLPLSGKKLPSRHDASVGSARYTAAPTSRCCKGRVHFNQFVTTFNSSGGSRRFAVSAASQGNRAVS